MNQLKLKILIKKIRAYYVYFQYFKAAIIRTYEGPLIKCLKFLSEVFCIIICRKKKKMKISNGYKYYKKRQNSLKIL